jgi:hypothetical protein
MRSLLVALSLLVFVFVSTAAADHWRRDHRRWNRHRPQPDLAQLQAVTYACELEFDGDANELACVQTVTRGRGRIDAASAIRACALEFDGDDNELACLAVAADARQDPAAAVAACALEFDGDDAELACVRTMTTGRVPIAAVAACALSFDGDVNEQACLDALPGTRYDAAGLVAYCDEHYAGDEAELGCLAYFR